MSKKSTVFLAASHLAMIGAGLWLAWPPSGDENTAILSQESAKPSAAREQQLQASQRRSSAFRPATEWRGGEFARAWKAVRTAKLSTPERIKVQRDLLRKWAETDLTAAIEAALGEAWDKDSAGYFDPEGPLLGALGSALAKDPAQSWDMIRGRQFGVGTGMLRHVWINAVGKTDPLFLASKIAELSWRDREKGLNACRMNLDPASETSGKVFAMLARLPEDVVSAEELLRFSEGPDGPTDSSQLKEDLLSLGSQDQRMAKIKAIQWGRLLASQSFEEIQAELAGVPDALRKEVLWSTFTSSPPTSSLELATLLASGGSWEKLEQRETVGRLQMMARNGHAQEVADWATDLPVRKETTELFHRSVDTYLRDNMEDSREWMASIPPGEWRDRAYAEYSQQALNAHNNPDASRWALDQIGDTTFKKEAESWRGSWEKRTGWTAK